MRKIFLKIRRFLKYKVIDLPECPPLTSRTLNSRPINLAIQACAGQDNMLYRLPYIPVYDKTIESLRFKGWQIKLEINTAGELEYSVYLERSIMPN